MRSLNMLTAASLTTIEAHWAAFLGCTVEELRGQDIVVPHHGRGIFILSRAGAVVAVPPAVAADRVVGPAFIGYLDEATFAGGDPSRVAPSRRQRCRGDRSAARSVRAARLGRRRRPAGTGAALGVFSGGTLAALSSYEIWSERIAHIGIVTHPAHRGRGLGTAAVRAMTRIAVARKLVAQYRPRWRTHLRWRSRDGSGSNAMPPLSRLASRFGTTLETWRKPPGSRVRAARR